MQAAHRFNSAFSSHLPPEKPCFEPIIQLHCSDSEFTGVLIQLGLKHHVFKAAEGEAFKMKEESKEPAYLIYRTTEFLLLIGLMHKVSKKNQAVSDKFSGWAFSVVGFYYFFFKHASISLLTEEKSLKHETKRQLQRKK